MNAMEVTVDAVQTALGRLLPLSISFFLIPRWPRFHDAYPVSIVRNKESDP